jgi:DNA-binding transcriptional LysR family regulator
LEELLTKPIRLRHLYIMVAIADRGSVRDASEQLFLTQPAASRSLRELEEALGLVLFARTARGMELTEAGEALLPHARQIVTELGLMLRHGAELRDGTGGEIRIGTVLAGSARLLPDAVLALKQTRPDLQVRIIEAPPMTLHEQLMAGTLDLVVGRIQPIASLPGVDVEALHDDSVRVVASVDHRLGGRAGSSAVNQVSGLSCLVDEPWVLPPVETSLRNQVDAAFVRCTGRVPADVVECVAPMPTRRMVIEGRRLAVVPAAVFVDDLERGDLVSLPVDIPGTAVPIGIITRSGTSQPASVGALIPALRESSRVLSEPHAGRA